MQSYTFQFHRMDRCKSKILIFFCHHHNRVVDEISELFLHLAQMFMDALRNEPCVILFDDLDKLIHRPDDRNNMASIRVAQLAERVGTLMRCVQSNRVAVVCTISSWENLNDGLKQVKSISGV